jgi:transcriptional regulator with XRE-family HTH domain
MFNILSVEYTQHYYCRCDMTRTTKQFGKFVKDKRLRSHISLREAARRLDVSAAYLSRVENGEEKVSGLLIARMAQLYEETIERLTLLADSSETRSAAAFGQSLKNKPELRALYRLGNQYDAATIDEMLRRFLREQGVTNETEIEQRIAQLKLELPRLSKGADNLLAAEVRPRCLSKVAVAQMAYAFLARHGLDPTSYAPPTEVEMLVEMEPDVDYRVDDLKCTDRGQPAVLGLSCWGLDGRRQIVVSSALADSWRKTDVHRFNFTLGHELFHALEHLPRTTVSALNRLAAIEDDLVFVEVLRPCRSTAERAVNAWVKNGAARRLLTHEDWREWQANTFAAALLMPEWAVVPEFEVRVGAPFITAPDGKVKQAALSVAGEALLGSTVYEESLADKFAVSRQAMAIRLIDLGLIRG